MTPHVLGPDRVEFDLFAADGRPGMSFEVDLSTAVGYWQPGLRGLRVLPPDWSPPSTTSLVQSCPLGALHDATGRALLGWAANEAVRELSVTAGVSEERNTFRISVRVKRPDIRQLRVRLDTANADLARTVEDLAAWMLDESGVDEDTSLPASVSAVALRPVYSTWYTFTQDLHAASVVAEAEAAVAAGCGSVFLDDGWQQFASGRGYQGCGDWLPDLDKFDDLAATVAMIKGFGAEVALWIAPLLLGRASQIYSDLAHWATVWSPELNCAVLDPRAAPVRAHIAGQCRRLVEDYGIGLLKVDFLEQAMLYADRPAAPSTGRDGWVADVGVAVDLLLAEVRAELQRAGHGDVILEFRQPYVSPMLGRHGLILRANDCPADSQLNRTAIVDSRLIAAGRIVHADPLMWGIGGGREAVAQQMLAAWFAVPQISMKLTELPGEQLETLQGLLGLWADFAAVSLEGRLEVEGAEQGYVQVRAVRSDLDRTVIACYAPICVGLVSDATTEILILNATPSARVLIETHRPVLSGQVRGPAAEPVAHLAGLAPGLQAVDVPPFGSVLLHLGAPSPSAGGAA